MAESRPPSRVRWLKWTAIPVVLVVLAYWVGTSASFVRAFVLPRVGDAMQSEVTVGDLSLSPFSSLTLRDLKVTPRGGATLLTASEVRARYGLIDILRGRISVGELTVENPVVTVVTSPDGTSNLSRIAASSGEKPPVRGGPASSVVLNLRNISLRNGTVRWTGAPGPGVDSAEISGLNVTLDSLVTDQPGRLTLGSGVRWTSGGTNLLAGVVKSEFQVRLNEKLLLREVNGAFGVTMTEAGGAWRNFSRLGVTLTADSTESEIRQVRLAVMDSGKPAGEVRLSGPFDPGRREARISYEVKGIGPAALGLVGAVVGMDFGATRLEADGKLYLERSGNLVSWQGRLSADPLVIANSGGSTPVLGLLAEARARVDLDGRFAIIERADLTVRQGGAPVVQGSLDHPMNLSWDSAAKGTREATYSLTAKDLDLASWRSWFGPSFPSGRASLETRIASERDGRLLRFQASGGVDDLGLIVGTNRITGLRVETQGGGNLTDFTTLLLENLGATVRLTGEPLFHASGMVQANLGTREFTGQVAAESPLPALLRAIPMDGVHLSAGTSSFSARLGSRNGQTNGSISLAAEGVTGDVLGVPLKNYEAGFEVAMGLSRNKMLLQKGSLSLKAGTGTPGTVEFTGSYEPDSRRGDFRFKSAGLNETALGPLLAPALRPRRMEAGDLNLSGDLKVDLGGVSSVSASVRGEQWVLRGPQDWGTPAPLSMSVALEATGRGRDFELKQFQATLPRSPRARNELSLSGRLAFGTNQAASGQLLLTSPGLDFTPLADAFPSAPSGPASRPVPSGGEPGVGAPLHLPVDHLTLDSKLDGVFYKEVSISNWVGRVEILRDQVTVNPFTLTLNGAPVSAAAAVNLGVPGYVYDVKARLPGVPVGPLAKSFLTGDQADLGGTLDVSAEVKGAGVTGAALRDHLTGNVAFAATNLNYRITALKTPLMRTLVESLSTALRLPSISESPIRRIDTRVTADKGVVKLTSALVESSAFQASAQGDIRLADVLTNSALQLPVTVRLPKTGGGWDELPSFLVFQGTLGVPKPVLDPLALARMMTRLPGAAGELSTRGVEKLGSALDRVLGGKSETNSGAGTSLIRGLLGGDSSGGKAPNGQPSKATNAPGIPANPADPLKKKSPPQ
ncbi:MAG: hypothetical protein JNL10_12105 [Verrucomicrobiales bacterium]|nr:hypothetical protein [Verrucomicrobiales bacterium]